MTKKDLTQHVFDVYRGDTVTQEKARHIVDEVFALIANELNFRGGTVNIDRFGKFTVKQKPARTGHNPKTGAALEIPARKSVSFKPSSVLLVQ